MWFPDISAAVRAGAGESRETGRGINGHALPTKKSTLLINGESFCILNFLPSPHPTGPGYINKLFTSNPQAAPKLERVALSHRAASLLRRTRD